MSEYKGIVDIPSIMPHQDKGPEVWRAEIIKTREKL